MKKIIIFLFFVFSSCSLDINTSNIIDPQILKDMNGLLFTQLSGLSYIFFDEGNQVLIKEKNKKDNNAYYQLTDGNISSTGVISYKLSGWGAYNNSYIAFKTKTSSSSTKASISLQNRRESAINALSSSSDTQMISGINIKSSALYTAAAISPIVSTSVAGIFKPDQENVFISINYAEIDQPTDTTSITVSVKNPTTGVSTVHTHNLIFQSNITATSTIFTHIDPLSGDATLYGIRLDMLSSNPRLSLIHQTTTFANLNTELIVMANTLQNTSTWSFGVLNALKIFDDSIQTFFDKTFIQYISPTLSTKYDMMNTSKWSLESANDTIRITKRTSSSFIEEDYLIIPTDKRGIYKLEDFQATAKQEYTDNYFSIENAGNNAQIIKIYNSLDTLTPIASFSVRNQNDITPLLLDINASLPPITTLTLGTNADGSPIAGRSFFQAFVNTRDEILLVGGYTNVTRHHYAVPRKEIGQARFTPVYNQVFKLTNLDSGLTFGGGPTPIYLEDPSSPEVNNLRFQQPIGATSAPNRFWIFGAGADGFDNLRRNISVSQTSVQWRTFDLNSGDFLSKNNQMMVAHNGKIFIMGGTLSSGAYTDMSAALTIGTFLKEVRSAPAETSINASAWTLVTQNAEWPERTGGRVFSIGKTMVLVGGYGNGIGGRDEFNDVWISENNGINWTEINNGGTPSTVVGTTSTPPYVRLSTGSLPGIVYNGIIFLMSTENNMIYYSEDKGKTWYVGPAISPNTTIGAQLVNVGNILYLIGGQSSSAPSGTPANDLLNMNKNVYRAIIR